MFQYFIFLGACWGKGTGCICALDVQSKPKISKVSLISRAKDFKTKGFRLAWHPQIHIELQGECSVLLGKGGFAIGEIKIAQDSHEEHYLEKKGYRLISNLHQFNLPTSIWAKSRQPYSEDGMYKYGTLTAMDWFDKRLIRCIQAFNLTEGDVLGIRSVFESIQGLRVSFYVHKKDIFHYLSIPYLKICEWIISGIDPGNKEEISFSEYLHTVSYFCLFGKRDLLRFVFGASDVDYKGYLRKDQFFQLVEDLVEGSTSNVRLWQMQYGNYADRKLGYMFFKHFENFVQDFNNVMWQLEYLHRSFTDKNLGRDFWDKKRVYFKAIKDEMGVISVG